LYPNPQSALPLPVEPQLEEYEKHVAELAEASGSEQLASWAKLYLSATARNTGLAETREALQQIGVRGTEFLEFASREMRLRAETPEERLKAAHSIVARTHGFESWARFRAEVLALAEEGSAAARFEASVDAIVNGDILSLRELLREDPQLVHRRSARAHRATLLHYVSANGVESYRQKTPKNIVEITRLLLQEGADVDAEADVYGGGCTTLGLAATSVHPEQAGVQEALLQTLLDHGATMEQPAPAGNGQSIVTACLANGRPNAARFLVSRGARLDLRGAAGLGRLDTVREILAQAEERGQPLDESELESALFYASGFGQTDVLEYLLARGLNPAAADRDGQTVLHWAVIGGHIRTVDLLLRKKVPLENKNVYGGTPLRQALWSAAHGGDAYTYIDILDLLQAAGAEIPERHAPINRRVDAWLAEHGSKREANWNWDSKI